MKHAINLMVMTSCFLLASTFVFANDPVKEFSITANPNGAWSYGFTATLGGAFTLYPEAHANYLGVHGSDIWNAGPSICRDQRAPEVGRIQAQLFVASVPVPHDTLYVHPGCLGQYSILRWTAPLPGMYQMRGSFPGLARQTSTTDVHILLNSVTSLLNRNVNGPGDVALFDLRQQVAAGDTVDFAIGFGTDRNYNGDSMGLQLSIVFLPAIDIKPGDASNTIQIRTPGRVGVAILSDASFDAPAMVVQRSLTFGRIGPEGSLVYRPDALDPRFQFPVCSTADVDGDGREDLVCQFDSQQTGFQITDTFGVLRGETKSGITIKGTDSVQVVP